MPLLVMSPALSVIRFVIISEVIVGKIIVGIVLVSYLIFLTFCHKTCCIEDIPGLPNGCLVVYP
jgi:hypothetical protein